MTPLETASASTAGPTGNAVAPWVRPLRWVDGVTAGASGPGDTFGLPIGTVTFLLTDIEGSTLAWSASALLMGPAVARHYEILDDAVARHGGVRPQEQGEGDSIVAAFSRASDALRAAVDAQVALASEAWPDGLAPLKVRMAVHAGEAQLRNEANYVGQTIIRTARLRAIAHGGQVVVSRAARDLTIDQLGSEIEMAGMHRLKDLARPEHVWQVIVPGGEAQFPPLKSLDAVPNNLPMALSTFVGRQQEIEAVTALARGNRLVTITGAGGAGKTRLAQQVAANLAEQFADGAWWIDLAPHDAAAVARVTADVVSVKDPGALAARLSGRTALLVFDNCEHVLETVTPLIAEILQKCPGVRILATSRGMLDVPGEVTWRVPPLSLPSLAESFSIERHNQFDAVRLFLDRARRARPNFELTNENGPAVAEICSRLDGLPLAIELAAARAKSLMPQQILSGLDNSLRMLTGGSRLVLPRQQTLEASIAWSHDLLDEPERIVLRRVSVFAGGWGLAAAEAVCADEAIDQMQILDSLERLIDQSLIRVEDDGSITRYRALETVRQFGAARLHEAGETAEIRRGHSEHYLALAAEWAPRCETGDEPLALTHLSPEHANLALSLRFVGDHGTPESLARATLSLVPLWGIGERAVDGVAACTTALERLGERNAELKALLLQARGHCQSALGQLIQMYLDGKACADLADSASLSTPVGRARFYEASVVRRIDPARAVGLLRRADEDLALANDRFGESIVGNRLAAGAVICGDVRAASPLIERARDLAGRCGSPSLAFELHWYEALNAIYVGDLVTGRDAVAAAERLKPGSLGVRTARAALDVAFADDAKGDDAGGDENLLGVLAALVLELRRAELAIYAGTIEYCRVIWIHHLGEYRESRLLAEANHETMMPGLRNHNMILFGALSSCALGEHDVAEAKLADAGPIDGDVRPDLFTLANDVASLIAIARGDLIEAENAAQRSLNAAVAHAVVRESATAFELLTVIAGAHGSWVEVARLQGFVSADRARRGPWRRLEPVRSLFDATVEAARTSLGAGGFDLASSEGAGLSLEDAVEFVNRSRGERGRATIGWAALTPTERRVADLVRSGLSNAAVGAELLMGAETVKTHLSRVFAKLGVNNRTKLAGITPPPPV